MSTFTEIGVNNFNLSEYGKLKVVGVTDEVTACFCCGKENLKRTAVMQDSEGNYSFFGTSCAHNASNKWATSKNRNRQIKFPVELAINGLNYRYNFELQRFEKQNIKTKEWSIAIASLVMHEILEDKLNLRNHAQDKLNLFLAKLEEYGQIFPF
jgi:hypothetical protein